jgi:hypothetical protein
VVAAQEVLQCGAVDSTLPTDISSWTGTLLPDVTERVRAQTGPHDVLLAFHARLLAHMMQWLMDRLGIPRRDAISQSRTACLMAHKRLAEQTNSLLECWNDDLKLYMYPEERTQQITLDYLNARSLVNSVLAGALTGAPEEHASWVKSKAVVVESALQLLIRCQAWTPAASLANLPHVYYRVSFKVYVTTSMLMCKMIALAAVEVVEALTALEQGSILQAACPTTVKEGMSSYI